MKFEKVEFCEANGLNKVEFSEATDSIRLIWFMFEVAELIRFVFEATEFIRAIASECESLAIFEVFLAIDSIWDKFDGAELKNSSASGSLEIDIFFWVFCSDEKNYSLLLDTDIFFLCYEEKNSYFYPY